MILHRLLPPLLLAATLCAPAATPPNLVVVVADDMGHRDAGFMGATGTRTPNLDRLAAAGAVLTQHYVQPVCSPTRAALLTGRLATRTGIYTVIRPNEPWGLPLAERLLPQVLKDAGYTTVISGKWHLGEFEPAYLPTHRGFDHQYGHWFGAIDYNTKMRGTIRDWHRDDQPSADEGYSTHLITDEAVRRIRGQAADKPLFLYLPFNAVHSPHQVPDRYSEAFPQLKGVRRTYAGMLAALDEAVGRVADALKETGRLDNTLILFTSDNGGPSPGTVTDNGPLRAGKGTIYEGGVRACAFVTWPRHIPAGGKIDTPIQVVDWFPTLAGIAGAALPAGVVLDGVDLLPLLTGGKAPAREALLLVGSSPEMAAVRVGDWKLLRGAADAGAEAANKQGSAPKSKGGKNRKPGAVRGLELYNLARDPGERQNLAEAEPERARELEKRLTALLAGAVPSGAQRGRAGSTGQSE